MTSLKSDLNSHILNLEMENHKLKKDLRERQFEQFTLSKIQQMAKVGTWKLNHLTYDVCLSQELLNMLGLDPAQCKLKWSEFINLLDPLHTLDLEISLIQLEQIEHPAIIHSFTANNNSPLYFKHYSHSFSNSIGQPLRTVGLIQDITDEFTQAKELEHKATTDDLTGLCNRRKVNESLHDLIQKAESSALVFSVMLFDLDLFKRVNDKFGHAYGDEVLIATANVMRKYLPSSAEFGRWGGEEFLVISKNLSLTDTCRIAQHIQYGLSQITFPDGKTLSASFGVTQFKQGDSFASLLTRVDKLMYDAKQSGRNSVICG